MKICEFSNYCMHASDTVRTGLYRLCNVFLKDVATLNSRYLDLKHFGQNISKIFWTNYWSQVVGWKPVCFLSHQTSCAIHALHWIELAGKSAIGPGGNLRNPWQFNKIIFLCLTVGILKEITVHSIHILLLIEFIRIGQKISK